MRATNSHTFYTNRKLHSQNEYLNNQVASHPQPALETNPRVSSNRKPNKQAETPSFYEEDSHSAELNNAPSHANYSTE